MLKHTAVTLALMMVPTLAAAQDGLIRDFRPADFEQVIRDDFQKEFAKKQTKNGIEYDIKDTPYFAFFNPGGKFLLFLVRAGSQVANLEKLNNWNRDAVYSRAYISGDQLIFEVPLGFSAGTSREIVRAYYANFEREFEAFKKAIQGN